MTMKQLRIATTLLVWTALMAGHAAYPLLAVHAQEEAAVQAPPAEEISGEAAETPPADAAQDGDPGNPGPDHEPEEGAGNEEEVENEETDEPILEDGMPGEDIASSSPEGGEPEESAASTEPLLAEDASAAALMDDAASSTATSTVSEDGPAIVSGEAVALANILNLVNVNFVNSEGVILFSNFFEQVMGSLDLRDGLSPLFDGYCISSACEGDGVRVNIANDAEIHNTVVIQANSGGNEIEGGEDASIETGDAYAGLNLVNIANTNFVDSEYLLVTMNAFEGVNGDIVFPSLTDFFARIADGASSPSSIDIENSGEIENDVDVHADSGGNTAEADGEASVVTGDAHGSSNVFNELNATLAGDRSVSILFRVHGSWAGEVFGAPEGLSWTRTADGDIHLFDTGGSEAGTGGVELEGENHALIHNDVSVVALTGDNLIAGSETALISTGDAYAGANIVNVANANVVGRNWILAVINIFGDFNGNIAFGRPDLWVGEQVALPSSVDNGGELTYTFTVINNGDSPATEIRLADRYDAAHLEVLDSSAAYAVEGEEIVWDLPDLAPGQATEVAFRARIRDTSPGTDITNVVTVTGRETDNNPEDNTDTATVTTDRRSGGSTRDDREEEEQQAVENVTFAIDRLTPFVTVSSAREEVRQELVIRNTSGETAIDVTLHDVLYGPSGAVLRDEIWELGDLHPYEEVAIGYQMAFAESAAPGTYMLETRIAGPGGSLSTGMNGRMVLLPRTAVAGDAIPRFPGVVLEAAIEPQDEERGLVGEVLGVQVANAAEGDGTDAARASWAQAWWLIPLAILALILALGGSRLYRAYRDRGSLT